MDRLGRHIIVEFYGCPDHRLNDVMHIETSFIEAAQKAEATVINSSFHHFSPFGVSGVVVISSRVAIPSIPGFATTTCTIGWVPSTGRPWK
jgi:spermidine synthase